MSIALRFELVEDVPPGPVSGLSPGHVTLEGPRARVTSAGRRPDQSMYVYISIVDLLNGLGTLLGAAVAGHWQWVGSDSSFVVDFDRRDGKVSVRAMGENIGEVDEAELAKAVWTATTAFLERNRPGHSDMVAVDLGDAVEDFEDRHIRSPQDPTGPSQLSPDEP